MTGVRERYTHQTKFRPPTVCGGVAKGVTNRANPPLAPEPTESPVGSAERIEVMARRLEDGYAIFHPDDSREAGEGTGSGGNNHDLGPKLYPRCLRCGRKWACPETQFCTRTCQRLWNEENPKTKAFAGLKPKRTA